MDGQTERWMDENEDKNKRDMESLSFPFLSFHTNHDLENINVAHAGSTVMFAHLFNLINKNASIGVSHCDLSPGMSPSDPVEGRAPLHHNASSGDLKQQQQPCRISIRGGTVLCGQLCCMWKPAEEGARGGTVPRCRCSGSTGPGGRCRPRMQTEPGEWETT